MTAHKYWYLLATWDSYVSRFVSPEKFPLWDNTFGESIPRRTIEEDIKVTWHTGGAEHFYNTGRDFSGKYGRHPDYPDQCRFSYFPPTAVAFIDPRGTVTSEIVWPESETKDGFPARWYEGGGLAVPITLFDIDNPGPGVAPFVGQMEFYRNTAVTFPAAGHTNGIGITTQTIPVKLPEYMAGHTAGFFYGYGDNFRVASGYHRDAEWAYMVRRNRAVNILVGQVVAYEEHNGPEETLIYVDVQKGTKIPWAGIDGVEGNLVEVIEAGGDDTVFFSIFDAPLSYGTVTPPERGDSFDRLLRVVSHTDRQVVFLYDNVNSSGNTVFTVGSDVYLLIIYDTLVDKFVDEILRPELVYNDAPLGFYVPRQKSIPDIAVGVDDEPYYVTCYVPYYRDPYVDDFSFDDDVDLRQPYTGLGSASAGLAGTVFYTEGIKIAIEFSEFYGAIKENYYTPEPQTVKTNKCMSLQCAIYELLRDSVFDAEAAVNDDHYTSYAYNLGGLHSRVAAGILTVGLVGEEAIFYHHTQDVFLQEAITEENLIFRLLPRDLSGNPLDIKRPYLVGSLHTVNVFAVLACGNKAVHFNLDTWQPTYELTYPFVPDYINDNLDLLKEGTYAEYFTTYFSVSDLPTYYGTFSFLGPLKGSPDSFQGEFIPYTLSDGGIVGAYDNATDMTAAVYEDSIKIHFSTFLDAAGLASFDRILLETLSDYESNPSYRTVVAGFSDGEHFNYRRPTEGYAVYPGSDGRDKITRTRIPGPNGIFSGDLGTVIPVGDLKEVPIVTDADGDEHWGIGTYRIPSEDVRIDAYWDSPLTKLRGITDLQLPLTAGYLLNGYRGMHIKSLAPGLSDTPFKNNPLIDVDTQFTLSVCFLGDTHPLVHLGGDIVEAVSLNGLGEISLDGVTGATYKAVSPGVDIVAAKDDYNKVVVYIAIYNMFKRVIALLDNDDGDIQNFTPTIVHDGLGQTTGSALGSMHAIPPDTAASTFFSGYALTHSDAALATTLTDYRSFPVSGFNASTFALGDEGADDRLVIGDTIVEYGAANPNYHGFYFGGDISNKFVTLDLIHCSVDPSGYADTREIYVNIDRAVADSINIKVGYQLTDATGIANPVELVPGATLRAVKRTENGYTIDLATSLHGVPLGKFIAVAVYDPLTNALQTWLKVARALPPLGTPVDADVPTTGISEDEIGGGEAGPILL